MAELREMSLRFDTIVPFLEEAGLRLEPDLTDCQGLYEGDNLIAFGALAGHTIKCLAVREDRRGEALLNILVSHLYTLTRQRGGGERVRVHQTREHPPLREPELFPGGKSGDGSFVGERQERVAPVSRSPQG